MIADLEHVALLNLFSCDPLPIEFNAVGRPHIDEVVGAKLKHHHCVLPRDVRIFQGVVTRLLAAADDEAVLVDLHFFAVAKKAQLILLPMRLC